MLHTDLPSDTIQNVEIVTDGEIDPDDILDTVVDTGNNTYVVVGESGNNLHIIDSTTGLTIATVPADQMHSVTMMEDESESLAINTKDGSVTMVADVQTDAEAITLVAEEDSESDAVKHAILVADVILEGPETVISQGTPLDHVNVNSVEVETTT